MIEKVEMYTVKCDNCGKLLGDDADYSCWNDEATAVDIANDSGWISDNGNNYCPNCWSHDDDDNIVLKMKKYKISVEIMNLTWTQWKQIRTIENAGFIEVTVKEFKDLVGFDGGMFFTGRANESEKRFIREFYNYGRESRQNDQFI